MLKLNTITAQFRHKLPLERFGAAKYKTDTNEKDIKKKKEQQQKPSTANVVKKKKT